mmetsp:Transcript_1980/g.5853  ORF Transcript_1980/g.5853 Transcript_1980/m.5853 type:complete len:439 (+) Transcript_1980:825-2141(+)
MRAVRVRLQATSEVGQGGVEHRAPQLEARGAFLADPAHLASQARSVALEASGPNHSVDLLLGAIREADAGRREALNGAPHAHGAHRDALGEVAAIRGCQVRYLALVQLQAEHLHHRGALDAMVICGARPKALVRHHVRHERDQPEHPSEGHEGPDVPLEPFAVRLPAEEPRQQDDAPANRQEHLLGAEAQVLRDVCARSSTRPDDQHALALELCLAAVLGRVQDPPLEGVLPWVRRHERRACLPDAHRNSINAHGFFGVRTLPHRPVLDDPMLLVAVTITYARDHFRLHLVSLDQAKVLGKSVQILGQLPMRRISRPRPRHRKTLHLQALLVHVCPEARIRLALRAFAEDPKSAQLVRSLETDDGHPLVEHAFGTHQATHTSADHCHNFARSWLLFISWRLATGSGAPSSRVPIQLPHDGKGKQQDQHGNQPQHNCKR